jgi:predicted membrane channel-forming protein YqfA (hemolysin III family)
VNNEKSPHILNAASNLLGICFIVLTSLKLLNKTSKTIIDEVTLGAIILFMSSCIFSFLSLRSNTTAGEKLERVADYMFIAGLVLLFVTTLLFSFNLIA